MSEYIQLIYDRIEFLEFKQDILFLKQPQHKASEFYDLTFNNFLDMKNFTKSFEERIYNGEILSIDNYEKELFDICPSIKPYPSSSILIAKALMNENTFNSLFANYN